MIHTIRLSRYENLSNNSDLSVITMTAIIITYLVSKDAFGYHSMFVEVGHGHKDNDVLLEHYRYYTCQVC